MQVFMDCELTDEYKPKNMQVTTHDTVMTAVDVSLQVF